MLKTRRVTTSTSSTSFTSSLEPSQLGASLGAYRDNPARIPLGVCGTVLMVVTVGALIMAATGVHPQGRVFSIIGAVLFVALCGAVASSCFWKVFTSRGVSAHLFENGFTLSRAGVITVARWEDVISVRESVTYLPHHSFPIWSSYVYMITLNSGCTVRIDHAFDRVAELGKVIQRMTTNTLLSSAMATYESGDPVHFGHFSVSQWGISYDTQMLLWRDLRRVSFERGVLTIVRRDKRQPWATALVSDIPNIYLFTTLISYVPRT